MLPRDIWPLHVGAVYRDRVAVDRLFCRDPCKSLAFSALGCGVLPAKGNQQPQSFIRPRTGVEMGVELTPGLAFTAAALALARKKLSESIGALVESATGNVKQRLRQWRAEQRIERLVAHVADIRMVKTLWSFDRRVDLCEFYYPQKLISRAGSQNPVEIEGSQIVRMPDLFAHCIVEGRVGFGKSILARYLTLVTLLDGGRIPVFVELRKLRKGSSLKKLIYSALQLLEVDVDQDLLRHLMSKGRLVFLFDGFDEVASECRTRLIERVEYLAQKYPATQIVITSRPGTEIFTSTKFDRLLLRSLDPRDVEPIVHRFMEDQTEAERLVTELRRADAAIHELLTTPLMITLLVISFRTTSQIPEAVSEFYSRLLITLLNRHDRSKPGGFNRPRRSQLPDHTMQRLFNVFSFITLQEDALEMPQADAIQMLTRASKVAGVDAALMPAYLDDIVEITSILLSEGEAIRFIHKSVQEFHAAMFISELSDREASAFYRRVRTTRQISRWLQVLTFLQDIDAKRFPKVFEVPDIKAFLRSVFGQIPASLSEKALGEARRRFYERTEVAVREGDLFVTGAAEAQYFCVRDLYKRVAGELRGSIPVKGVEGFFRLYDVRLREAARLNPDREGDDEAAKMIGLDMIVDEYLRDQHRNLRRLERRLKAQGSERKRILDI
jgi:hypothetical protein